MDSTEGVTVPSTHFCVCVSFAATQLARQLQQECTQVVRSDKVARKCLARRHSRNGPWTSWQRIHMQSNKREIEQNTHQEKRNMDEEHTPETIISFYR